jgi:hypothetical protein
MKDAGQERVEEVLREAKERKRELITRAGVMLGAVGGLALGSVAPGVGNAWGAASGASLGLTVGAWLGKRLAP